MLTMHGACAAKQFWMQGQSTVTPLSMSEHFTDFFLCRVDKNKPCATQTRTMVEVINSAEYKAKIWRHTVCVFSISWISRKKPAVFLSTTRYSGSTQNTNWARLERADTAKLTHTSQLHLLFHTKTFALVSKIWLGLINKTKILNHACIIKLVPMMWWWCW